MCGRGPTAAGTWNSTPTPCRGSWSTRSIPESGPRTIRKEAKTYFRDCLQNANWLMRALDQRARTILKVASEIVRQQDGFFAFGVEHLRPLNLKPVAEAIGMHRVPGQPGDLEQIHLHPARPVRDEVLLHLGNSVVRRRRGPLRRKRASQDQAADRRRGAGRRRPLRRPAGGNTSKRPGVDIARRTVAKYREAMRIPSSVQRRRDKQSMLGNALSAPAASSDRSRDTAPA